MYVLCTNLISRIFILLFSLFCVYKYGKTNEMAITLAQSLGQNIGIFSDKKRILNGMISTFSELFLHIFITHLKVSFWYYVQVNVNVMISGQAASWMMLGKLT